MIFAVALAVVAVLVLVLVVRRTADEFEDLRRARRAMQALGRIEGRR